MVMINLQYRGGECPMKAIGYVICASQQGLNYSCCIAVLGFSMQYAVIVYFVLVYCHYLLNESFVV